MADKYRSIAAESLLFALVSYYTPLALSGQIVLPPGAVEAQFESWDGTASQGMLHLRLTSGEAFECRFTGATFFDRERVRISASKLKPGEAVQVLGDRLGVNGTFVARMVRVVAGEPAHWGRIVRATEQFAPRGSLLLSGVVAQSSDKAFVLRLRNGKRYSFCLRPDTRFAEAGLAVGPEMISVNRVIHVRGGWDWENRLEVYQVSAGEILQPVRSAARLR